MPCHTIPCHTIPYHTIPCHTIPYHTIPYHAMPCHTIPYQTTPYHNIPRHRRRGWRSSSLHGIHIRRCISNPPGAAFQARLLDKQEGVNIYRTIRFRKALVYRTIRFRKALGEAFFQRRALLAPALFQLVLWRCRSWKIGPGGCAVHRRIRYPSNPGCLRAADSVIVMFFFSHFSLRKGIYPLNN